MHEPSRRFTGLDRANRLLVALRAELGLYSACSA